MTREWFGRVGGRVHRPRWLAGWALLLAMLSLVGAGAERPPNFVVILADDLGYGDLSCYGGEAFETPHLDRLAAGGLRFTDFHSNGAVCSPTRAALMTGRYQQRSGVDGVIYADPRRNRHEGLDPAEVTLPELLQAAGYATGCFGKWHLGYERKFNPVRHGFDEFRGYVSGNVDFQSHIDGTGVFDWWNGDEIDRTAGGYTTHLITRGAVDFVERHAARPFFLYVPHEAPHYPYQGPGDPPLRAESDSGEPGAAWDDREPLHMAKAYAEMIGEMDRGIGEIVAALQRCGVDGHTLVFFFSDNGATGPGSNGALRGNKGSLWEGGHRVPAIARWPGVVGAGGVSAATALGMDLMPTVLDFAGVPVPDGHELDGVSLKPVLASGGELAPRDLFWAFRNQRSVRRGNLKLTMNRSFPEGALHDLGVDVGEATDLAAELPETAAELAATLEAWAAEVGAAPVVPVEEANR